MIGPARTDSAVSLQDLIRDESASASFLNVDASSIAIFSLSRSTPEPGCHVVSGIGGVLAFIEAAGFVNMGEKLTLSGPEGKPVELTTDAAPFFGPYRWLAQSGPYRDPSEFPPPVLGPGEWRITAPGSEQAKGFQVALRLPPAIQVSNFGQLRTIERTQDLTVTWDPRGYAPSDTMELQLYGSHSVSTEFETTTGAMTAACTAPATAGRITIPSALLHEFDAAEPIPPVTNSHRARSRGKPTLCRAIQA